MRTLQQIIDDASTTYNPNSQTMGMMTRTDLMEVIEQAPQDNRRQFVIDFINSIPFMSPTIKDKAIKDLDSFGL